MDAKTGQASVEAMLHERSGANGRGTHGPYAEWARVNATTCRVWEATPMWELLTDDQRETLRMVSHKVARICTGDPETPDHWKDIAGYATLSHREVVKRAEQRAELHAAAAQVSAPLSDDRKGEEIEIKVRLTLDGSSLTERLHAIAEAARGTIVDGAVV